MFDYSFKAGTTSQRIQVMLRDSTTGGGKTGVAYTSPTASYCREGGTRTAITLASGTAGDAFSSGKWAEVDATNQKGLYQLHVPDAAIAAGVKYVDITIQSTGVIDKVVHIELIAVDQYDSVRGGMTALPNAAASAVGGLPVAVDTSGRVDVLKINGTSQTARDLGASVLLSSGTGTGQISLSSGLVTLAGVTHTGAVIPTVTTVGTLTTYTGNTPQTGDSFARIGAAGAGLTALGDTRLANLDTTVSSRSTLTQTQVTGGAYALNSASFTCGDTRLANLDAAISTRSTYAGGAVASVTGAVGSVTGSVGSVTSAVTVGTNNDKTGYALSSAGVQAIWDALTSALATVGSIGKKLADWVIGTAQTGDSYARIGAGGAGLTSLGDARIANLDAAVSSRSTLTQAQVTGGAYALSSALFTCGDSRIANLDATVSSRGTSVYSGGPVASVTGSVGSVSAAVTVGTNNDKSGYSLSSAGVQAIWDALTSALTTVGSIGKKLADWVIGATQTGDSYARIGSPAGASISADIASIPKTNPLDTLSGDLVVPNSIGVLLKTNIDATISSRAESVAAGTGGRTVVVYVDDGNAFPTMLQNATVRLTEGANTYSLKTGESGSVTFNLDDATYSVAISKAGWTFSGDSLVVNGDNTKTYSMDALSIPSPNSIDETTAYLYAYDENNDLAANVSFQFVLVSTDGTSGKSFPRGPIDVVSAVGGLASFSALQSAKYNGRRKFSETEWGPWVSFTTGTGVSSAIPVVLGKPFNG